MIQTDALRLIYTKAEVLSVSTLNKDGEKSCSVGTWKIFSSEETEIFIRKITILKLSLRHGLMCIHG